MNIGIYKITSPSGKIYIGQSNNLKQRKKDYIKTTHCKGQVRLYNSLKKYGFQNHLFEIIENCSIKQLNNRERYWQDHYNVIGKNGLNCKLQSTKTKKLVLSKEARNKISVHVKKNNPMFRQDVRDKLSKANIGDKNPMFGRTGDKNHNSKKIICSESGKIYNSIKQASKDLNINYSTLRAMIQGRNTNKTTLNYN